MENLSFKKLSYRNEIDGLRAIAVISVIINHFNKDAIPSGYLGVDIFFVISGYVITSSIVRREEINFFRYIFPFFVLILNIIQIRFRGCNRSLARHKGQCWRRQSKMSKL